MRRLSLRRIQTLLFFLFIIISIEAQSKTTEFIIITPQHHGAKLTLEQLQNTTLTLFKNNRTDSLVLDLYNHCSEVKGRLNRYNNQFIHIDKKIGFDEVKIQHPDFITSFYSVNKTVLKTDSIDEFNKRHHILIYSTTCPLESECDEIDFNFYYNTSSIFKGGNYYRNHLAVLLIDTLNKVKQEEFLKTYQVSIQRKENSGKLLLLKLKEKEVKDGKNKTLKNLLLDTLTVRDAGVLVDTIELQFISSFAKIHSLPMEEIENLDYIGISQLKSMIKETNYATTNELEWGSGLYQRKTGIGYNIINEQTKIKENAFEKRCEIQEQLKDYDLEYLELQTYNLSVSGGEDRGRKKYNNVNRMLEIKEKEKELFALYNAHFPELEIVIIKQDYSSWPKAEVNEDEECKE